MSEVTVKMKRKLDDCIEIESYGTQRQSVLHMSVSKLKTPRINRVDPGLRRWVLILNTLKNIETELQSEGVIYHPPQEAHFISNSALNDLTLDSLPDTNPSHSQIVSRTDIVTAPKFGPKDIEMTSSIDEEKEEKTVLDLLPCRLPGEYNQQVEHKTNQDSNNNLVPLSSTPMSTDATPDYDPLHDIDISVCDFSDFSTFANSVKLAPLSAEDVLHTFPCPAHESASNIFNTQCGSYCKNDHFEDLDHIIQILVGM